MERDKDEMQRLTEMLNDPNAEFEDDEEEIEEPMETDKDQNDGLIENEVTAAPKEKKNKTDDHIQESTKEAEAHMMED